MNLSKFAMPGLLMSLVFWPLAVQADDDSASQDSELSIDFEQYSEEPAETVQVDEQESWYDMLFKPMRLTLKHEVSYKAESPKELVNNRSSLRVEYFKFFLDHFFVRFDSKMTAHWGGDHLAEAENDSPYFRTNTKEAFLQGSFGDSSIKVGTQTMIWGTSDGGAITDVISPRNFSELFLIPLEESRIGQFMVNFEQFSDIGNWSLFYVPDAGFNEYAEFGSQYYYNAFGDAELQQDPSGHAKQEAGLRWSNSFGSTDISLMAASMVNNDYVYRLDGATDDGRALISKTRDRYNLAGMTFKYVVGNYLFKGEVAAKTNKAFSTEDLQLSQHDVYDSAFSLQYSLPGSDIISIEYINNHIADYDQPLLGYEANAHTWVFNGLFFYMNEDLQINIRTTYTQPYSSLLHSIRTTYEWSDDLLFFVDAHILNVKDPRNGLYANRDQSQLVFKVQYQF